MSYVSTDATSKLEEEALNLTHQINKLLSDRDDLYQQIAELSCPYKVGDKVFTNSGLGVNGLKVVGIVVPSPRLDRNRWALDTLAYSKSGELTRRSVLITHYAALCSSLIKVG